MADHFRFHLTLTGKLPLEEQERVSDKIQELLPDDQAYPFEVPSISLVGEGEDGFFRLIRRFPLEG